MKKYFLLLSCFFATTSLFAQKGLEFGLRVMPQGTGIINTDDFDEGPELNFRTTIHLAYGVHIGYNFSDNVGIQTGIMLSQQGQKYVDDAPTEGSSTSEVRLSYLKIPLLLKLNTNPHKGAQFVTTLGVQIGLLNDFSYYEDEENVSDDLADFLGVDPKSVYQKNDLSAVLSLGARFRLTDKLQLGTHLHLNYSISDIENKDFTVLGFPFWGTDRVASQNATAGLMVELNYALGGSGGE